MSSGVASASTSSTPASAAMARRGHRVVAGDHHGADAHRAHLVEALAHALLDDVLEVDDAEQPGVPGAVLLRDHQRRAAGAAHLVDEPVQLLGRVAGRRGPGAVHPLRHRGAGPLADLAAGQVEAAHPGAGGELHQRPPRGRGLVDAVVGPADQVDDAAALGRLVGERGRAARPRRARASETPVTGSSSVACRLPSVIVPVLSRSSTSMSPAASTARPDMASTLRRTSRSMPGDADGRQQRADRGRDQADQQRDQHQDRLLRPAVVGDEVERRDDRDEDRPSARRAAR